MWWTQSWISARYISRRAASSPCSSSGILERNCLHLSENPVVIGGWAYLELQLQLVLLLEASNLCISPFSRVVARNEREFVSIFHISFVELPITRREHHVGIQQTQIALVRLLCTAKYNLSLGYAILQYQVCQIVVDEEVSGDSQPCWSSLPA